MTSRICRCCGEWMAERGHVLSRNPNVCASCSSLADGMDESSANVGRYGAMASPEGPARQKQITRVYGNSLAR
jgi:hypothetical protein